MPRFVSTSSIFALTATACASPADEGASDEVASTDTDTDETESDGTESDAPGVHSVRLFIPISDDYVPFDATLTIDTIELNGSPETSQMTATLDAGGPSELGGMWSIHDSFTVSGCGFMSL